MKKTLLFYLGLGILIFSGQFVNAEDIANYSSNGTVEFIPSTDITDPVNPTNPDPDNPVKPIDPTNPEGPNPGTNGPLSIDYASSFDFGVNKISNKTQTYYARAQTYQNLDVNPTPNYVQVSDNRGSNVGWILSVKQNGQFKNERALHKELEGAELALLDPVVKTATKNVTPPQSVKSIKLSPSGESAVVLTAKKDTGAGTWVNSWGEVEQITETDAKGVEKTINVTKAVALTIPGSTPKDAVAYSTTITWLLTDAPLNTDLE